ncbi:uncharacterized protein PHALS_05739 [Plasmopara halstedii]|uniref:Uncharacterized protein n=1 Tax=Plasmopara halstedii TaxID=4781 RepID=A0A0P1AA93_PLAHL|nr:uncharacterized protein PHALS_05739 [Plasmopara halstedii]CEG37680.1 hypothetical protein PHALS_05739 [Plasmopara halstedii]|eukprot:XP_024574049.1 hypothetical protein PHALS_05739 [Plasmopara halstedii]
MKTLFTPDFKRDEHSNITEARVHNSLFVGAGALRAVRQKNFTLPAVMSVILIC